MACIERVRQLIVRRGMRYELIPHREAYTSQEVAQTAHVAGRRVAKVVVLREAPGSFIMTVLPASEHLDLAVFHHMTGRQGIRMATEQELKQLFPDCELGAMPPFGNQYGMPTYMDACFWDDEDFYFQAGNHHEVVRMRFSDYETVAGPFAGGYHLHEVVRAAGV
jgi:Ala-tRNA(Pro) deacylase